MGGQNPYIDNTGAALPRNRYRITFLPMGVTVEVDPARLSEDSHGLPGSILDIALKHGIELDHACGGVCACSTCHVIVREGLESCNEPTDEEEDQLDDAYGVTPKSRLACQCVADGTMDVIVEVPGWNRNLSREGIPFGG